MAITSKIAVSEGSGKNIGTNSITEDAVTKEIQRVVPNTSLGADFGTQTDPVIVDLKSGGQSVQTQGNYAHDSADGGNPVKIGSKAKAALSAITLVAGDDRSDAFSDLDGAIIVRDGCPLGDRLSERVSNTDGASTAFTNFAAVSNVKNYVTGYSVHNASATGGFIDFRDGTSGAVLWTVSIPAGGGANLVSKAPLFNTSANTALAFDVSAALTTVYISVTGFKSKI